MQALEIILSNFISQRLWKIPIWMTVNIVSLKILLEMVFVMMKLIFIVAILMMVIVVEISIRIAIVYNANAGVCQSYIPTVVCIKVHKIASVWCKTALGEVGVSLPW